MKKQYKFLKFIILSILLLGMTANIPYGHAERESTGVSTAEGTTTRVSVASDGTQGNGGSGGPSISADGRYVAFSSDATNLVSGDINESNDVFVHDRQTGKTTLVSLANDGSQGNDNSYSPSISADGRYVAFSSWASNLVEGDTNGKSDVFVRDREKGETTRVSVTSDGSQGIGGVSWWHDLSANGRYVTFVSRASNLVEADNEYLDEGIFIHDRETGETTCISLTGMACHIPRIPSISADGRYVAFRSSGDINVYDRDTGEAAKISIMKDGDQGNGRYYSPSVSAGGRYIAFSNFDGDTFVHDRETGETKLVSVASDGTPGDWNFEPFPFFYPHANPSISADGRYVAFDSFSSNLVDNDMNNVCDTDGDEVYDDNCADIFIHDQQTGKTAIVSVANDGTQANSGSGNPSISADGRFVAFDSGSDNLVPGDTNEASDVFVRDLGVMEPVPTQPRVEETFPEDNARGVNPGQEITVTFNKAMDRSTINTRTFKLNEGEVSGEVTFDSSTYTASFIPEEELKNEQEYVVTLSGDIADEEGNSLSKAYTWSFVTAPEKAVLVLSSPLEITPEKDQYFVGDSLTASFVVKNQSNIPIILDKLLVGGRLNGWCPEENCPDFSPSIAKLNPGETYRYKGAFTPSQPGNYHFFVAFYIEDPTSEEKEQLDENNWNTAVALGEGVDHEDRIRNIVVLKRRPSLETSAELQDRISRELKRPMIYPPYLLNSDSFSAAVCTLWADFTSWITRTALAEKYEELYKTGVGYDNLRFRALKDAQYFLEEGDDDKAEKYLQKAYTYGELSAESFRGAAEVFEGNVEAGIAIAEGISDGCESTVSVGVRVVYPPAAPWVDRLYMVFNFAIDTQVKGVDQATQDLIVKLIADQLLKKVEFVSLDHSNVEEYVNRVRTKETLDELVNNEEFMEEFGYELRRVVAEDVVNETGRELGEKAVEEIVNSIIERWESMDHSVRVELKSPGELRVLGPDGETTGVMEGEVRHEISRSYYHDGLVTVFFPTDSYRYQVAGTREGSYGLEVELTQDGQETTFTAVDVATSSEALHQYTVDWDAIRKGNEGVTVQMDSDGDGVFEQMVAVDEEFAQEDLKTGLLQDIFHSKGYLLGRGSFVCVLLCVGIYMAVHLKHLRLS